MDEDSLELVEDDDELELDDLDENLVLFVVPSKNGRLFILPFDIHNTIWRKTL